MKTIPLNTSNVSILRNYDQNHGTDISNMLEMVDNQLSALYEQAEKLLEPQKEAFLKHLYFISTLQRQISAKITSELFLAIDNLLYEIEEQQAS